MSEVTQAQLIRRIIAALERDLNDRKGFHINDLPGYVRVEIRQAWRAKIKAELDNAGWVV